MKFILAALLAIGLITPAKAQAVADKWIEVIDPVLNPFGLHKVDRHYLQWDGRSNCGPLQKYDIILNFHGGHGSAENSSKEHLTPKGCNIVVWPSGSNKDFRGIRVSGDNLSWNTSSQWDKGFDRGWAGEEGVRDDDFIKAVVAQVKKDFPRFDKVFGVGASRGGMLTFHLACTTNLFNAIATVATVPLDPLLSCAGLHLSNFHIHGTDDSLVCWSVMEPSCEPWPVAENRIKVWQNQGVHKLLVLSGGTHRWPPDGTTDITTQIYLWLASR